MFETIRRFESTTSTNDEAIRSARAGAPEGEVFVAETQTKGRGRLGRIWESPQGKNLAVSLLLRPQIPPAEAPKLTLVAGAAIHETLLDFLPQPLKSELRIKWPNDVYCHGKKLAGVLAESETQKGKVDWVVLGIGIDVNAGESDFSSDIQKVATSLQIANGRPVDKEKIFRDLLNIFERRYREFCKEGFAATRDYVQAHGYLNGKEVHAAEGSLTITGVVQGVSEDGTLRIRTDAGQIVSIIAGDVRISR